MLVLTMIPVLKLMKMLCWLQLKLTLNCADGDVLHSNGQLRNKAIQHFWKDIDCSKQNVEGTYMKHRRDSTGGDVDPIQRVIRGMCSQHVFHNYNKPLCRTVCRWVVWPNRSKHVRKFCRKLSPITRGHYSRNIIFTNPILEKCMDHNLGDFS